ncbi:MAG: hypothetical protein C4330_01625 [Chitinophagaceae bacterium]
MKKLLLLLSFFFLLFCLSKPSLAQNACTLRISLLTCAAGDELYSTFGHTAVRVSDTASGIDYVYNYGTFEFGPDFYTKFIRGKLLYFLSVENFSDFLYEYRMESRSVQEQVLNLDCAEKQKLLTALQTNAQPQNRYYRYDFLFDNCTTRAKDIIAQNTAAPVVYQNILPQHKLTFRDLIHQSLDAGHQYWSKLGIDMLLGAKIDKQVTNEQAMFLPHYLLKGLDSAHKGRQPLVAQKQTILQIPSPLNKVSIFQPAVLFALLLLLVVAAATFQWRWSNGFLRVFDFLFFFLLGIAGISMLFMWFGTDHTVCSTNYNLAWALPTNLVAAFFIGSEKSWVRNYFAIVFWITLLLLAAWFFLPQQMNEALLPVVAMLAYRSYSLAKK